jgi:hypothetical protein
MGVSCTLLIGWLQAAVQPFCAVFVGFPAVMFCTVSVSYGPVVGLGFGCGKVATSVQLYVTFLQCGVAAWRMMGMHQVCTSCSYGQPGAIVTLLVRAVLTVPYADCHVSSKASSSCCIHTTTALI